MKLITVLQAMTADKTQKWAITHRGELVRSASERRIANFLFHNRIQYKYEKQLRSFPLIGTKIAKPDFYLPKYKLYIEYWGLVNAFDLALRMRYVDSMNWKINQYREHDVKFIGLIPDDLKSLRESLTGKFQQVMGFPLPTYYQD